MTRFAFECWLLLVAASSTAAFTIITPSTSVRNIQSCQSQQIQQQQRSLLITFAEDNKQTTTESISTNDDDDDEDDEDDEDLFDKVELLGKGAAKAKRGKRKGSSSSSTNVRPKSALTPEEIFYEGPPAITETIIPTISILTVVGIIPAAAAWARQAWVRYKITSRRIRVQSGFNGNEMAEIVYPDIIELRTVKRLFGDGDMVAFLRDGAKFEMRNIPNFDDAIEFILKQVDNDVAKEYREKGDVSKPN